MTSAPYAAVTYVGLPISSGGAHSLGRVGRREAHHKTMEFLRTCAEPVGGVEYAFRVNDMPGVPKVGHYERELHGRFARFPVTGLLGLSDSKISIAAHRVDDALEFLDAIDPQPTDRYGMERIWFWLTAKFRILDPATGRPLPGQDPTRFQGVEYEWSVPLGSSGLRLMLHNHASIGIELCIPDADDDVLRRVVPWLQQHLPFKLSGKQWRAWTPTKAGSFKARRMSPPAGSVASLRLTLPHAE